MREEMMQTRLAISAVALVLSAGVSVQTATACSKEAVAGVVDRWTTVLAENNPDTIVALYSKDAVLWGHAFAHGSIRSCRAEVVLRGCLPSAAEAHRQVWRAIYPRIWRYRSQHGLLHAILHQGRRNQ